MLRGLVGVLRYRAAPGESLGRWSLFRYLCSERYWDWRLGVNTRGHISPAELGLPPGAVEYGPTPYRGLHDMLASVPLAHRSGTFVDFGCGKGRAMLVACRAGFRPIVGVELAAVLCAEAEENLKRGGVQEFQINCMDAAEAPIPDSASIYFFYNPFSLKTLCRVLDNIHASHVRKPRPASLLFVNSVDILIAAAERPWLILCESRRCAPDLPWTRFELAPELSNAG
jgi:hypothetical protein